MGQLYENGWQALLDELRQQAVSAGNDPGRVDRGLELVVAPDLDDRLRRYGTTDRMCGCRDRELNWRKVRLCKHQLAIRFRAALRQRLA